MHRTSVFALVISLPFIRCSSEESDIYNAIDSWEHIRMTKTLSVKVTPGRCAMMCLSGKCDYFVIEGPSCTLMKAGGLCMVSLGDEAKMYGSSYLCKYYIDTNNMKSFKYQNIS